MKKKYLVLVVIIGLLFSGCWTQNATLKTFIDPSIQTTSIKTVAVFSMRNTAFSPGETMEMDRTITQEFIKKNNSVTVISTSEANAMLNKENLAGEFAEFLTNFEVSGIPNTVFLSKLKTKFNIDAILQGRLSDVKQNDAGREGQAKSSLTIRYTLLSTSSGSILWEGTSNANIVYGSTKGKIAPPFYEVGKLAQEKIISSIPTLAK